MPHFFRPFLSLVQIAAVAAIALSPLCFAGSRLSAAGQEDYPPVPAQCNDGNNSGHGGNNCTDRPDTISIYTGVPTFVRKVNNGARYLGGSGDDTFHIAHVYSDTDNLYEMGFALGQLFPSEMADMFDSIIPWVEGKIQQALPSLPQWIVDLIAEKGLPVAMELVYDITEKYMPQGYLDEWQGIADGANCSVKKIRQIALFPQFTRAECTIFVSHKNATVDGDVHHLRCLDFDATAPIADFASVIVYHYKTKPQMANFGWLAVTGVLTGMSDVPVTVGQKVWGGHAGPLKLPFGLPWMAMLRQSLELRNLTSIESYIVNHSQASNPDPNSIAIHIGYGDGASNEIIGYEVGYNYSQAFHWNTTQFNWPKHPLMPGIVYWSKNDCCEHTNCVKDMILARYGKIDAKYLAMYYAVNDKTGDTQVVGFDHRQMLAWVANNRKTTANQSTPMCAYYRQRTLLDMRALFSVSL
jgi:hypothetical protein